MMGGEESSEEAGTRARGGMASFVISDHIRSSFGEPGAVNPALNLTFCPEICKQGQIFQIFLGRVTVVSSPSETRCSSYCGVRVKSSNDTEYPEEFQSFPTTVNLKA